MGGEAVPRGVHRHPFAELGRGARRAAGGVQHLNIDRPALVPAGEQPLRRSRQPPVGAQDAQQLRRQHDIAVFAALAVLDPDYHPAAVDIADFEPDRLRGAQPGGISGGQRSPGLQARHRFEKTHHLIGAQHDRQLARLAGVRDAFRDLGLPEGDAVEEPQRANRLIERRPGDAVRHQMDLKGTHIFEVQPLRRAAEIPAELRHRMHVGSLRCRRQIADRHILDHAATQRAHLGHRGLLSVDRASTTTILSDGRPSPRRPALAPAQAG